MFEQQTPRDIILDIAALKKDFIVLSLSTALDSKEVISPSIVHFIKKIGNENDIPIFNKAYADLFYFGI